MIRAIIFARDSQVLGEILEFLSFSPLVRVVASAVDPLDAITIVASIEHDVLIVDQNGGINSEIIHKLILSSNPRVPIIAFSLYRPKQFRSTPCTEYANSHFVNRLSFGTDSSEFSQLLENSFALAATTTSTFSPSSDLRRREFAKLARLTAREREVFLLRISGWRQFSIANKLGISASTVSQHVSKIMKKLECSDSTDLVRYAFRVNIL